MKNFITLYLEINNSNFFFVVSNENLDNIKIIYKLEIPLSGLLIIDFLTLNYLLKQ